MDAGVLQSHTASQQWQSFEIRMRRKRVDRCVLRAAVAIDAGILEDAREALEEVERLDPHEPSLEPLRTKLAAAESRAAAGDTTIVAKAAPPEELVLNPAVPVASRPEKNVPDTATAPPELLALPETQRRVFPASAAAVLIAISGTTGWFVFSHNSPAEPAAVRADTAVVYDSAARATRSTAPAEPAVAEPAVRISEIAVNAAALSESVEAATPAPVALATAGETALNSPVDKAAVEVPLTNVVTPAAEPPSSNTPSTAPNTTAAANNRAPNSSTPPPAPANDRAAVPASVEPSPPLPDLAPPPPVTSASNVVPSASSSEPAASPVAPATAAAPAETSAAPSTVVPATLSPAQSQQADENRVRSVLKRYEAAYSALDASAASTVWPGVDRRALTSAFQALSAQSVSLGRCDVRLTGEAAQADCKGTASWQPKVGGGPQTAARQWRFDLRNAGGDWVITRATVR